MLRLRFSAKNPLPRKAPNRCPKLLGTRSPIKHSVKRKVRIWLRAKCSFAVKALQMRFAERLAFKANRLKSFGGVTEKKGQIQIFAVTEH